jgi:toxin FitB
VNYLLDTNAVSEWMSPRPDVGVVQWFDEVDEDRTHLSVLTLGELRKGVARLAGGRKRDRLDQWLRGDLPDRFAGRVLPVDSAVADEWGRLTAAAEDAARTVAAVDALIAATAKVYGLQVVTRNVAHFRHTGVEVVSPWLS